MKSALNHKRKLLIIFSLVVVLLVVSATFVYAGFMQDDGTIKACVLKDGTLYLLNSATATCKKTETLVQWNITGPKGDTGATGETGPAGAQGLQGEQGPAGPASLTAFEGTDCTRNSYTGQVHVDVDGNTGSVSVTCLVPPTSTLLAGNLVIEEDTSIAIGADHLPVISFYSYWENGIFTRKLRVAHCDNVECTSATITTPDSTLYTGYTNAIAIGTDGLPIISYSENTAHGLKVLHCKDAACTTFDTPTILDRITNPYNRGGAQYTSIAIGTDGLPVISYYFEDYNFRALKVAHCNDTACTSAALQTVDMPGDLVSFTSIAIGVDGFPVISYFNLNQNDQYINTLKVVHCLDAACATFDPPTNLNANFEGGTFSSIAIGADGLPVISYYGFQVNALQVAHCNDAACTSAALSVVDAGEVGMHTSIAIGTDGLPVISYYDSANHDLKFAHCSNAACTNATTYTLDSAGSTGEYTSLAIGFDGFPVISYSYNLDSNNRGLKVIHCSNAYCAP